MRYLTLTEVVELHRRLLEATGGAAGIRGLGALESALAQLKMTLAGGDLYRTLPERQRPSASRWWETTLSWTGTSASVMPPWRRFSC